MKSILFTAKDRAELVEEPKPSARTGEVVVRLVRRCISSGTERANVTGVPDGATGIFGDENDMRVTWPPWPGLECAGEVLECPANGRFKVMPLVEATEAHAILERGENRGKVVLSI
jgi:NADPH:quinone reductase-like Zn-dependent oxidoreductase